MKSGHPARQRGSLAELASYSVSGRRPATWAAALACASFAMSVPSVHAEESKVQFNIAAQSLYGALHAFSTQSHRQVLFDDSAVGNRKASAVQGMMTPRQALDQLLAGTGIQVIANANGVYTLKSPVGGNPDVAQLPAIQVTASDAGGGVVGYVAERSMSGTKTDTALIRTPQAISVVTSDQMQTMNVQSVAQALRYTSGVTPEQRGTNTASLEYLYLRGFQADEYLKVCACRVRPRVTTSPASIPICWSAWRSCMGRRLCSMVRARRVAWSIW